MKNHDFMKDSVLISIIIPTYNRAHIIRETLDSIRAQTHTKWECIVVDDGSTDNTAEVMADYKERDDRFYYYSKPEYKPKGPCSCRNYGYEKSKGDYINFFDSDDLFKTDALEKALHAFNRDTDAVIMNSALTDFNTGKQLIENTIQYKNLLTDYFVGNVTFLVCGPMWRREFLGKQPYLFDENIGNIDDWDFNLRMLYANPKLVLLDTVLIYYRKHSNSFSREVKKLNKIEIASDFKARDKHLKLIEGHNYKDIDKKQIQRFILNRYKRYFKWAIGQEADSDILTFLIKSLVHKHLAFHDYFGALKSGVGYIVFRLTGKGYAFFKE
ncbi:MAG: glycosyltransferase family A protein [Flavobacteriaceae bacterium]